MSSCEADLRLSQPPFAGSCAVSEARLLSRCAPVRGFYRWLRVTAWLRACSRVPSSIENASWLRACSRELTVFLCAVLPLRRNPDLHTGYENALVKPHISVPND